MRRLLVIVEYILIASLLSSCYSSTASLSVTGTPTLQSGVTTEQSTSTPGENKEVTVAPSVTPITPTRILIPTENSSVIQQTVELKGVPICPGNGVPQKYDETVTVPGTILYQKPSSMGFYTLGNNTIRKLSVSEIQEYYAFGLSPDGIWIAYSPITRDANGEMVLNKPTITLMNTIGERIDHTLSLDWLKDKVTPGYKLESFIGGYWINNNLIFTLIHSVDPAAENHNGDYIPAILDPFKGEWKVEYVANLSSTAWGVFSPDMSRGLYQLGGVELLNLKDGSILWKNDKLHFLGPETASWSPDNSQVVFTALDGFTRQTSLLLLSADGKQLRDIKIPELDLSSNHIYWSPDGGHFSIYTYYENKFSILVYDATHNAFSIQCPVTSNSIQHLVWSPDSSWIAFTPFGEPLSIFDVASGNGFNVLPDAVVVGWSDQFVP